MLPYLQWLHLHGSINGSQKHKQREENGRREQGIFTYHGEREPNLNRKVNGCIAITLLTTSTMNDGIPSCYNHIEAKHQSMVVE